jgi:hypothetical protein
MFSVGAAPGCSSDTGISGNIVAVFPRNMAAFPNCDVRHLLRFWNQAGRARIDGDNDVEPD